MLIASACASGRPPATDIDAAPGGAGPDAMPKRGFGEPCTDRDQCESDLCILIGTAGHCTQFCGSCPDGWGCIGVLGIDVDGQISHVCVPSTNQLCTPCTADTECALVGMDKCVGYPDGDRYCAQDCSTIGCPGDYACQAVTVNSEPFQQCIPTSGACDCNAQNPGDTQPCTIETPFNSCGGAQTCNGATGWSGCQPPSQTDDPDPAFVDSNCDGIDGDIARAIFVSGVGANTATCGLVYTDPCQTIQFATARAMQENRPHLYVQSGTYTGPIAMANGISLFGGYDVQWQRAPYSEPGHTTIIQGGNPTVTFNGVTAATALDNVIVRAADGGLTASSVGVLVTGSMNASLRGVEVTPGNGGSGSDGANGTTGASGGPGGAGSAGCENSSGFFCAVCPEPPAGRGGTSSCGHPGGDGGAPGQGGNIGNDGFGGAFGSLGGIGAQCASSRACDGQSGGNGAIGSDGLAGTGGGAIGSFAGATYVVANGTAGTAGQPGQGGGGGGGGGGGSSGCDSYGSAGGGGGAGGCGGGGGGRGGGGGGSFGVIAFDSQLVIDASTVVARSGGVGGRGGSAGTFGSGGIGGPGGPYDGGAGQDDGGDGAPGGNGGRGGFGGAGGGGGGGPSIALVCLGASAAQTTVLASTLAGGTGGAGGISTVAPGQPGTSAPSFGCQ